MPRPKKKLLTIPDVFYYDAKCKRCNHEEIVYSKTQIRKYYHPCFACGVNEMHYSVLSTKWVQDNIPAPVQQCREITGVK